MCLLSAAEAAELPPLAARQRYVKIPADDGMVRMLDIFIARDGDGELRGFENFCPHAGGPLNMFPVSGLAKPQSREQVTHDLVIVLACEVTP